MIELQPEWKQDRRVIHQLLGISVVSIASQTVGAVQLLQSCKCSCRPSNTAIPLVPPHDLLFCTLLGSRAKKPRKAPEPLFDPTVARLGTKAPDCCAFPSENALALWCSQQSEQSIDVVDCSDGTFPVLMSNRVMKIHKQE